MQKNVKTPEQALQSLMTLCAKAERSSGDAMRLMARWGVDEAARQEVLKKLISARFIDDERYAGAYVREKSNLNGWGAYKIRAGLAAKGIQGETALRAMQQIRPEKSREKLEELLRSKMRSVRASTPYDMRAKLVRFGLSRGFEYDILLPEVEKLVKTTEEDH